MSESAEDQDGTPTHDQEGQHVAASESAEEHGASPTHEHGGQQPVASGSAEEHSSPAQEAAQQPAGTGGSEERVIAGGQSQEGKWPTALLILGAGFVLLLTVIGTILAFRALSGGEEPTTANPGGGGAKILMCTARTVFKGSLPPDGLCNVVVYETLSQHLARPSGLRGIADYAKQLTSSHGGLSFRERTRKDSLAMVKTPDGEKILRSLWSDNVRSYGALGPSISADTTSDYIDALVDLLTTLKKYQDSFTGGSDTNPRYIFVGVAPLYKKTADTKGVIKGHFDVLMSKAAPNLVLFQTSDMREFQKNDPGCMSNAISPWKDPPLVDQPSFVDTLSFRKTVTLPPGTSEMLSMSLCMRFALVDPSSPLQLGEAKDCLGVDSGPFHDSYCDAGRNRKYYEPANKLDTDRWVYLGRPTDHTDIAALEKKDTIQKKMCKASVEHHYTGGWVMYGLECNDNDNECKDANFTAGFARVHWMKHYMTQTFTTC